MKTKLSPLEELRLQKMELAHQCKLDEQRLLQKLNYTKGNLGHLTINTLFSSAKSGASNIFHLFMPGGSKTKTSKGGGTAMLGGGLLAACLPFVWDIAQPMIIGFVVKKAKSLFTSKKKN